MPAWRYVKKLFLHSFVPGEHNAHRPRVLHRPWLLFFLALILATEGFLVSNLIARQSNQQFLAAVVPGEIIALTNTERADNNVGSLTDNIELDAAALAKAKDMATNGYFSHVGPDGKTPWQWIDASGYVYQYAGENLAVRFVDSTDVVNAWMESPTHRANMVKPVYTEIGVGVAEGLYQGEPATYVVQYFGTPKSAEEVSVEAVAAASPSPVTAETAPTSTAASSSPVVEGASTQATPVAPVTVAAVTAPAPVASAVAAKDSSSFMQSFGKQALRALNNPRESSNLMLSVIASLVLIALFFTFFVHIQVQHPNMLAGASFVAALALFFIFTNAHLVGGIAATQSASVISAQGGVVISSGAADTGYALFPQ